VITLNDYVSVRSDIHHFSIFLFFILGYFSTEHSKGSNTRLQVSANKRAALKSNLQIIDASYYE
jgi:hypothetical protein